MDNLKELRVTVFTITASKIFRMVCEKFIFDCEGRLIAPFGEIAPDWFIEKLRKISLFKPHISGSEIISICSPDNEEYAAVLAERFIDATMGDLIDRNAESCPDHDAVVDVTSGAKLTYSQLKTMSDHLAKKFIDLGIEPGNTVALTMPNSVELLVAKFAICKIGAVIVNMSPYEKGFALKKLLNQCEAAALVLKPGIKDEEIIENIYSICPEIKTAGNGRIHSDAIPNLRMVIMVGGAHDYPGTIRYEKLMVEKPKCVDELFCKRKNKIHPKDVVSIIYTSGTTGGDPKGAMLTHAGILENGLSHARTLGFSENDRIFTPTPMFHTLADVGACVTAFLCKATMFFVKKSSTEIILNLLSSEKITVMLSVPEVFSSIVHFIKETEFDTRGLRLDLCVLAGSACLTRTIRDIHDVMNVKNVVIMYGLTEASPGVSSTRIGDNLREKCDTVGKAWPGQDIMLADKYQTPDGIAAGEICIRGYNVMKGYYKNYDATARTIDEGGWLHTGDIASIGIDGEIVLQGRKKDIIIHKGENISPIEIEEFLKNYSFISEAYVVGAKDCKCGEVIYAFVKPQNGSVIDEHALTADMRGKIASIKIPSRIYCVEDFPRTNTGKVLKRELRVQAQVLHDNLKGDVTQ